MGMKILSAKVAVACAVAGWLLIQIASAAETEVPMSGYARFTPRNGNTGWNNLPVWRDRPSQSPIRLPKVDVETQRRRLRSWDVGMGSHLEAFASRGLTGLVF
jgi:hypothetical protein